eukprot:gnl/TRDRNA2_/TRDRNA2_74227_c0_seq1.p1 gnl/TRDRNA2_/TRDRNA2_74227_c0~~gnl/TRDRNA2_/TRDRNA2_74227_c0_seq1.p1  ORF type:complete len:314 (+),score=74.30 gnl/TRDRNA2_/TRDRNA2_74227_c0_seq1:41-943(+)
MPVAETFTFDDKKSGILLKDIARLDTLVTVVDGMNILHEMQSIETTKSVGQAAYDGDERPMSQLLVDQIEFANVILLNKCDMMDKPHIQEVHDLLKSLNPEAEIHDTVRSVVPLDLVLNTGKFSMTKAEANEKWLKEAREGEHVAESEEFGISSFIYRRRVPFHPGRFGTLLREPEALPATVLRAKGFVWIATRPSFSGMLNCVGKLREFTQGNPWWAAVEKDLWPEALWEDLKPLWHETHGDRSQEIVVIGKCDKADVEARFDACLLTENELAQEQPWQFPDELPIWENPDEEAEHKHS